LVSWCREVAIKFKIYITLEGKQLNKLIEPLHDEKVRYVQEFNATRFDAPEDGEVVIEKITVIE